MKTDDVERLKEQLKFAKKAVGDMRLSKNFREGQLRYVRELERQLGLKGDKYNG